MLKIINNEVHDKQYNFFIIASPLQLFNAIEAIEFFKTKNNVLFVVYIDDKLSLLQIKRLLKYAVWEHIEYILFPKTIKEKIIFANKIDKRLSYWKDKNFLKIFVGEYRSTHVNHIVNFFNSKNIYLLDDGLALLSYSSRREKISYKDKLIQSIYQLCFYKLSTINYTFFTIFDLEQEKIIKNNYTFFKRYIEKKEIEEVVYFIGQSSIEKSLKDISEYKNALIKILKFYKNKNFVYILHRRQNDTIIKQLSLELGFECKRFDNLIELEIIFSSKIPSNFGTFFSTGIMTLPKFFDRAKYTAFQFDYKYFKDQTLKRKNIVEDCYIEFTKNDIEVQLI